MLLTAAQREFQVLFAGRLRAKADEKGVPLEPGKEEIIARQFIVALIEVKQKISEDERSFQSIRGETSWSSSRAAIISRFAETLDEIFSPVGGIKPKDASAYWSGPAVRRAADFGTDFASTIPGFVVNEVSRSLQETFMQQAYKPDGHIDTAANLAMWDAMSKIYAEGTIQDAHVFLVDGETSQQSIFWNTELETLRKRQATGQVHQIFIHSLTPEALEKYRMLVERKKGATTESGELANIAKEIDKHLKTESNWSSTNLDSSQEFKLKISGLTEPHKTVTYQTLKEIAQRFKNNVTKSKVDHFEKNFNALSASIDSGNDIHDDLSSLRFLQEKVSLSRDKITWGSDDTKQRLVLLEQKIIAKITEANTLVDALLDELPNNPVGPSA